MKKYKLKIDDLKVESFHLESKSPVSRGTVFANATTKCDPTSFGVECETEMGPDCSNFDTCGNLTCNITCENSCNYYVSCNGTMECTCMNESCDISCDPCTQYCQLVKYDGLPALPLKIFISIIVEKNGGDNPHYLI